MYIDINLYAYDEDKILSSSCVQPIRCTFESYGLYIYIYININVQNVQNQCTYRYNRVVLIIKHYREYTLHANDDLRAINKLAKFPAPILHVQRK